MTWLLLKLLPGALRYTDGGERQFILHAAIPSAAPTPIDLLNKLDADNQLTQRNLRETIMLMNEAFKMVSNNAVDLSNIPGVAQVYAVEAQAAVLRGQL